MSPGFVCLVYLHEVGHANGLPLFHKFTGDGNMASDAAKHEQRETASWLT